MTDMERIEERFARLEMRQEATIKAIDKLMDVIEVNRELLGELLEWANKPASGDLPEALQSLTIAIKSLVEHVAGMPTFVAEAVAQRLQ